ncbi:nucleoside triphosphate pyrophosphohydrolase [Paenibacillus sp. GYB006]|uniref:nucleoside triphosphate pyrophosphohydrolase n=1 Tax=Paenibacillus sp. GYB006 TaxID=2994394 RepID=UPI002F969938
MRTYNKLVRDLIPSIIQSQGKQCKTLILDEETYKSALRAKLEEEHREYQEAETDELANEELSDMLEVIYALASIHGISEEELNKIRKEKAHQCGEFKEKIFLVEVD